MPQWAKWQVWPVPLSECNEDKSEDEVDDEGVARVLGGDTHDYSQGLGGHYAYSSKQYLPGR
eukprot:5840133-Ditylum_brightwellii.AAC.1